jgi:hypothetical protein
MFCRSLPLGDTSFPDPNTFPDPNILRITLADEFCGRVEGGLILRAFPNVTYIGFSRACWKCLSFARTPTRLEIYHGCLS